MNRNDRITIVGAGLAGTLLAVLLTRRGARVDLFERYPDPRAKRIPAGRSINLALAERGRSALDAAGLLERVEEFALPMAGRMLHDSNGGTLFQSYGQRADEVIWSVHRGQLNRTLLDAAEDSGVKIHFDRALAEVDFDERRLTFTDDDGAEHRHSFELAVGADGAGSALRRAMDRLEPLGVREEPLGHGYMELTIPPGPDGEFRMRADALHIWPRGGFMMIALPNPDGSFTCTLFLDNDGDPGFQQLDSAAAKRAFVEAQFADAVALMPDMDDELASNPVGYLATLYVDRWTLDDRAVILGDAAHAIVPFHGQGMNAAFEDTVALVNHLESNRDRQRALEAFQAERKPNADAIAAMALDNYLEMRDRVRDPRFQLQKELEFALEKRMPDRFIPRYSMVMFHADIPYAQALERGNQQARLLEALSRDHRSIEAIDLDAAADRVRRELPTP
jgi:kynurenine 3-monooxygenase